MNARFIRMIFALQFLLLISTGCSTSKTDTGRIEEAIRRYNTLLAEGYRTQDMNPLQEVTTREQAVKLYHHMAALGEGRLRLESQLKEIDFKKIERRDTGHAVVETEEIWDFTHYRTDSGEKHAEERDFVYRMGYILQKKDGRWVITEVTTIGGTSTNCVIPLPVFDRHGKPVNRQPALPP